MDLVKKFYEQKLDIYSLEKALENRKTTAKNFSSYSLNPYSGEFDRSKKKHLLNRILVGLSERHLDELNDLTLEQSIDLIFTEEVLQEPTNLYYHELSPEEFFDRYGLEDVGPNEPFVNRVNNDEENMCDERRTSTFSVFLDGMYSQNTSIHWKLFIFLYNLVPSPFEEGSKGIYNYCKHVFDACFGSYKDFIYNITLNESMMVYLNLYLSKKETPDENFAREIQELFTQGKRPTTQFTEDDVRGIARALVGWSYDTSVTRNRPSYESYPVFHPWNHDTGDKYFSSYYNNRIIRGKSGEAGAEELQEVIDMLFETEQSAQYIVRRLYQFFVYPVVTDEIESEIIQPLAIVYKNSNYSISEPLKILLSSEHFFSDEIPNSIIKSPIDFLIGMMKEVDIKNGELYHWNGSEPIYGEINPDYFDEKEKDPSYIKYYLTRRIMDQGQDLGMKIGEPPSVSGWPSFYQAPVFDLFWINSTTSPLRSRFAKSLFTYGLWLNVNKGNDEVHYKVNYKNYLLTFENPYNINSFLNEVLSRFLSIEISDRTRNRLKDVLLDGNSEIHWIDDITNLLSDSPDINHYHNTNQRIGLTLSLLTTLGEYQLH